MIGFDHEPGSESRPMAIWWGIQNDTNGEKLRNSNPPEALAGPSRAKDRNLDKKGDPKSEAWTLVKKRQNARELRGKTLNGFKGGKFGAGGHASYKKQSSLRRPDGPGQGIYIYIYVPQNVQITSKLKK